MAGIIPVADGKESVMKDYTVLLKNGRVWDGEKFLPGLCNVAVKDGVIAKIGEVTGTADFTLDVKGKIIAPGLVDSHVHIRGCSPDSYASPIEATAYPFGVTAVIDAAASLPQGPVVLDNMLLHSYVFVGLSMADGSVNEDVMDARLALYGHRALGVKIALTNPEAPDIDDLRKVCAYARSRGLRVMVHTTGTPVPMKELLEALAPGDICTHTFHHGKHTVLADMQALQQAQMRGVIIDDGQAAGGHMSFAVAKACYAAGIYPDTVSSDITPFSGFKRGGNYGLTTCMTVNRALGMTEEQVLACVTGNAARVIGKEAEFGFLAQGRPADICVLGYGRLHTDLRSAGGLQLTLEEGYYNLLTLVGGVFVYRSNREELEQA